MNVNNKTIVILCLNMMQVLFLGSGDLRNAIFMASECSEAYSKLDIHISDNSDIIIVRNFLIIQVVLYIYILLFV